MAKCEGKNQLFLTDPQNPRKGRGVIVIIIIYLLIYFLFFNLVCTCQKKAWMRHRPLCTPSSTCWFSHSWWVIKVRLTETLASLSLRSAHNAIVTKNTRAGKANAADFHSCMFPHWGIDPILTSTQFVLTYISIWQNKENCCCLYWLDE